jgi:dihydroflavonol-4-reductase
MEAIMNSTILVTGRSGFVGSHVVLQLLNAGYTVRTTVRSLDKEQSVRLMLKNAGAKMANRSEIVAVT